MTQIDDAIFDTLLTAALYRASELEMPSDMDLEQMIQPSRSFQRKMSSLLRNPKRYTRNLRRTFPIKFMRATAAVFLMCTLLFGAVMAVSPTVRATVVEFVMSWFEDRTEYRVSSQEAILNRALGYMPDGFELIVFHENEAESIRIYQNEDAALISIIATGGKQVVDNEHSDYYQTTVRDRVTDVYASNDPQYPNIIVIYDDTYGHIFTITSEIELNELLKIAENLE